MRTSDLLTEGDQPERTADIDLLDGRADEFRGRWTDIQTGFVDEPQHAVERADSLVAEVITAIAERFTRERGALEERWSSDDTVSTEDLRVTLRHYRDFFERLLDAPGATGPTDAAPRTTAPEPTVVDDPDRSDPGRP